VSYQNKNQRNQNLKTKLIFLNLTFYQPKLILNQEQKKILQNRKKKLKIQKEFISIQKVSQKKTDRKQKPNQRNTTKFDNDYNCENKRS